MSISSFLQRSISSMVTARLWLVLPLAFIVLMAPARADEFETVPAGDPLYAHVEAVTKAGWLSASRGPKQLLTRYEVAFEAAKAISAVTARHRVNPAWDAGAARPALRALRDMTVALRGELRKLDVDVNAALTLFDSLLKSPSGAAPTFTPRATPLLSREAAAERSPVGPRGNRLSNPLGNAGAAADEAFLELPLSQRLRVRTAFLALAREENDPFGDAVSGVSRRRDNKAAPTAVSAGAAFDVTNWLTLRAAYERRANVREAQWLPNPLSTGANAERTLNSGVDLVLGSLTVSGDVARIATNRPSLSTATRFGGGLGLTAWQNRLSLRANVSRLVPEDSLALSQTAAELNIGVDVTRKLSLGLLYQKLFGAPNSARPDRVVAGGLSISF